MFIKLTKPNSSEIYLLASMIYKIEEKEGLRAVYYRRFGENGGFDYVVETSDEIIEKIKEVEK